MKEIHIIDEGHGWYLYSTTGEREDAGSNPATLTILTIRR